MTTLSIPPLLGTPAELPCPAYLGGPLPDGPLPPVPDLVTAVAARTPSRPAVRCGTDEMSYAELGARSSRIAAALTNAGVGRGDRVAVLAEASTATVAAILAVLRCGAAYVPLDPGQPDQRLTEILADAQVSAALVSDGTADRLAGTGLPLVPVTAGDTAAGTDGAPVDVPVLLTDPAYLIYTSGSTGEPKGVVVEHGQLAASTLARRLVYPGEPTFLLVSPLSFDSSVAGLWGTLTAGGCLIVATGAQVRDPEQLVRLVDDHRATHLLCIPSLYSYLLDATERLGGGRLESLRTAIVAGEALPQELVERHFVETSGRCELVNEYGPTEATVWATYQRFTAPAPVTIGRPIPGARVYLLDEQLCPVPVGESGELYVAGAGVARGYHGRPEATARAFRDDPFAAIPGERMYRTGDLCRWTNDGALEFLGRRDHQVKVRGHRIELSAVEAQLCALPGVREAVVVPAAGDTELVGFVLSPPELLRSPCDGSWPTGFRRSWCRAGSWSWTTSRARPTARPIGPHCAPSPTPAPRPSRRRRRPDRPGRPQRTRPSWPCRSVRRGPMCCSATTSPPTSTSSTWAVTRWRCSGYETRWSGVPGADCRWSPCSSTPLWRRRWRCCATAATRPTPTRPPARPAPPVPSGPARCAPGVPA